MAAPAAAPPSPAGHRGGNERPHPLRARELGKHLFPVDGEHPGLVHQPADLVGPPHPGLVRRGRQCLCRPLRSRSARQPWHRRRSAAAPGRGRARHLVLLGLWPFSTLGWPQSDAGADSLLPHRVLVTGFDIIFFWVARMIMMGLKFTGRGAVSGGLHPRSGARRRRPEDVQVQGQRARPDRPDRRHRPWMHWSPSAPAA